MQTKLERRISQEEPSLDPDIDLWTCTTSEGRLVVAPTAEEANELRRSYEASARAQVRARKLARHHGLTINALDGHIIGDLLSGTVPANVTADLMLLHEACQVMLAMGAA